MSVGPPGLVISFSTDVDHARERLLNLSLEGPNVVYFHGWTGFGASAVLRSIAMVLASKRTTKELCFDRILYIDCSEWKSRRAMQRTIVKELKLDSSVLAILDKMDEEDDFYGVDQASRGVIESVSAVIDSTLTSTRFMMIFLNGTDDEVDVTIFGIPQFTVFRNNKMIWTFKRRILTINNHTSEAVSKLRYTHAVSRVSPRSLRLTNARFGITELTNAEFEAILHEEANTIVARNPCMIDIKPKLVTECCLYELFLHYNFHNTTNSGWATHASNYWLCDGIIQGDMTREITNACQREINWKCDPSVLADFLQKFMRHLESPFLAIKDHDVYKEGSYRWISVTSENTKLHGLKNIPATTSSFFLAFKASDQLPNLPNGLFQHSSKLGVLILRCCAFNFASPPFLKCHNLRFLGLDHCTDEKTTEGENHTSWLCLYNLWVLDLRYTEWNEILSKEKLNLMTNIRELNIEGVWDWKYTTELQGHLSKLQRLRLIKPTCQWNTSGDVDDAFIDKTSMEILDLSGNSDMTNLPTSLSKASSLQMLVLDGCDGLEAVVAPGRIPPSLMSFRFDGCGAASQWTQTIELPPKHVLPCIAGYKKDVHISKISLQGCTQLENLFLRGLPNLLELDLSGTAIKVLDFKTMVVQVPRIKRLFLIGCKHLRAIGYLSGNGYTSLLSQLELMCIDTRAASLCSRPAIDNYKSSGLQVHAVVVDARITRSLGDLFRQFKNLHFDIHITRSPVYDRLVKSEATDMYEIAHRHSVLPSFQELVPTRQYSDVLGMAGHPPMQAFPQPPSTKFDRQLEIAEGSCYVENGIYDLQWCAESLHFHDVSSCATIDDWDSAWDDLRLCCVERSPKLEYVFNPRAYGFLKLETLWASDLLMARCIWSKGVRYSSYTVSVNSFKNLQHLHLHSCPRLQFVLPVWVSSFPSMETLCIINCCDLSHVFELDETYPEEIATLGVLFPKLTTIYLHNLPKLQNICKVKVVAPTLRTIKIRGCWSLRRLPTLAAGGGGSEKKPAIDIEKDVWDALEWDTDHRPDHFEAPVQSRYYKKKLPRVSVLR